MSGKRYPDEFKIEAVKQVVELVKKRPDHVTHLPVSCGTLLGGRSASPPGISRLFSIHELSSPPSSSWLARQPPDQPLLADR